MRHKRHPEDTSPSAGSPSEMNQETNHENKSKIILLGLKGFVLVGKEHLRKKLVEEYLEELNFQMMFGC